MFAQETDILERLDESGFEGANISSSLNERTSPTIDGSPEEEAKSANPLSSNGAV